MGTVVMLLCIKLKQIFIITYIKDGAFPVSYMYKFDKRSTHTYSNIKEVL